MMTLKERTNELYQSRSKNPVYEIWPVTSFNITRDFKIFVNWPICHDEEYFEKEKNAGISFYIVARKDYKTVSDDKQFPYTMMCIMISDTGSVIQIWDRLYNLREHSAAERNGDWYPHLVSIQRFNSEIGIKVDSLTTIFPGFKYGEDREVKNNDKERLDRYADYIPDEDDEVINHPFESRSERTFNPKKIIDETVSAQRKKRVNEEFEYEFNDFEDMKERLRRYVDYLFRVEDEFSGLGKWIDDFLWSDGVVTVETVELENGDWVIMMNPDFAEMCLDRQKAKLSADELWNKDEDPYPDGYFRLFSAAVLYATVLGIFKSSANQGVTEPVKSISNLRDSYPKAFDEAKRLGAVKMKREFEDLAGMLKQFRPMF